jgi:ABC-type antimicrobial peptide transport system permease subunit
MLYVPLIEPMVEPQIVPTDMTLVVRAAGAPLDLTSAVRARVREVNPRLSIGRIQEFESIVRGARAEEAFAGALLGAAALVAFVLGIIGVHGSVAQQVRRRRQEIGVRVALGARRSSIVRLVTTAALSAAGGGVVAGMAAALAGAQGLAARLYGVEPRDPATLALVCALLMASAALAALTASLRGTRVPLVTALRGE